MLSRENPKAIRQYQQKSGKSPGNQVKEKFLRTVKRTATVLFLGLLTMLLLAVLVYLAATGGGPPERNPVPRSEGVELLRAGAGAPGQPAKQTVALAGDFSVLPERSSRQKPRSSLALWY